MKMPIMYYYRKIHRYLGVIIGIQFIFWTLGGIFFAWSDMDQIHGDTNRISEKLVTDLNDWQNPSTVFNEISMHLPVDSVISFRAINFIEQPFYQVRFYSDGHPEVMLVNAKTGQIRPPLNEKEALKIASNVFTPKSEVEKSLYLTSEMIGAHHEYRGRPLPAYAVTFAHNSGTTVYVSTEYGQVMTFRNSNWRIFDFFWMMHTMDYQTRDHIGNTLLKVFSILGLLTVLSGFILYFKTSLWFRRK